MSIQRVQLSRPPFDTPGSGWRPGGVWPAKWITASGASASSEPSVLFFRLRTPGRPARLHITADQRYELYVGGWAPEHRVGRGPERGDERHWRFESYDVDLPVSGGIGVKVWWLGAEAPLAQHSVQPAFLLAAEGDGAEAWNTGEAAWQAQVRPLKASSRQMAFGAGAFLDGVKPGHLSPNPGQWVAAEVIRSHVGQAVKGSAGQAINAGEDRNTGSPWRLVPSMLAERIERPWEQARVVHVDSRQPDEPVQSANADAQRMEAWQKTLDGESVNLTMGQRERVLVDLGDYICGWPRLGLKGEGFATIRWAESLFEVREDGRRGRKEDRNAIEGKVFHGVEDQFVADESVHAAEPHWWRAGRYVQLELEAGPNGMQVGPFKLTETHYPHHFESRFEIREKPLGDDLEALRPLCERTLLMCSHETYMDCPYYEQLQYIGDTRLQVLLTYALTPDDRLARQAIQAFNDSRLTTGLTRSRYPSSEDQVIPPFSLWWVAMVHDFAMWRDDGEFVQQQLPGVRAVLDAWLSTKFRGWMFVDWDRSWDAGVPADATDGGGCILNAQLTHVLRLAADLEGAFGEPEMAARYRGAGRQIGRKVAAKFDRERGVITDGQSISEHAQILALLSPDVLAALEDGAADGMWEKLCDPDYPFDARATVYFSHYLFELCHERRDLRPFNRRLDLWRDMLANGCRTTVESPEPSRSDCHAWSAHPLLHAYTTCLGVRPSDFGFKSARVAPLVPGTCEMLHPRGRLRVEATGRGKVSVEAPEGVHVDVDDAALPGDEG